MPVKRPLNGKSTACVYNNKFTTVRFMEFSWAGKVSFAKAIYRTLSQKFRSLKPKSAMKKIAFNTNKIPQYFLQGLLILAPSVITVYLLVTAFQWLDDLLPISVQGADNKPYIIPGLGFVIIMLFILTIGYLSNFFFLNRLLSVADYILEKIPGVKVIYTLVKDFSEAVAGKKRKFSKPVLVSIYQQDVFQLGFITNEQLDQFDMREHLSVYIPSSYAVAGTLFMVKRERVKLLQHFPPADAMKFAISGGVAEVDENYGLKDEEEEENGK